jgi:hypothetical protein
MKRYQLLILLILSLLITCGCQKSNEYRDKELSLVVKAGDITYLKLENIKSVQVKLSKKDAGWIEINLVCKEIVK